MKTLIKIIYVGFVTVALAMGALTAKGAPGDIFEGDFGDGIIYKFAPDGTQSFFASGLSPLGLAFDSTGYLYAADAIGRILKFAPDGTATIFATGLIAPYGLAFDTAGNLFVADGYSGTIYKFAPDATRNTFATGLDYVCGLAFDSGGNLFATDIGVGAIYKFAPNATRSTFGAVTTCFALAFDSAGYLFATDSASNVLYKFAPDGARSTVATGLNYPVGLAFDTAGYLFLADFYSNAIYKFAPDATRGTFATGLYNPAFLAIQPPSGPSYAAQVQPPINADGTSIFTVRRGVIPVKFTLTQGGIVTCDLPPATIAVTRTGGGVVGQVNESTYAGSADSGTNFRISNCQYVYNLNSAALGVGVYRVDILIAGQNVGTATFELR